MKTLHAAFPDADGRSRSLLITWPDSDYTGSTALPDNLPKARGLVSNRGFDADWFRFAPQAKGIEPCILGRKSPLQPVRKITSAGTNAAAALRSYSGA